MDNLSSRLHAVEVQTKQNSSKQPSSDGMKKPPKQSRKSSGKKPGGKEDHEGSTLKMVKTPDRIVEHTVERCGRCGSELEHILRHLVKIGRSPPGLDSQRLN